MNITKNTKIPLKRQLVETIARELFCFNEFLADKSCKHCGESETVCLKFYPHDAEIRKITKRVGVNNESRKEIIELIDNSVILCSNCWIKNDNDLIEFIQIFTNLSHAI